MEKRRDKSEQKSGPVYLSDKKLSKPCRSLLIWKQNSKKKIRYLSLTKQTLSRSGEFCLIRNPPSFIIVRIRKNGTLPYETETSTPVEYEICWNVSNFQWNCCQTQTNWEWAKSANTITPYAMESGVQRWIVDISEWNPSPAQFCSAVSVLPQHQQSFITRYDVNTTIICISICST